MEGGGVPRGVAFPGRTQSSGGAREGRDLLKIYVYFGDDKAAGL